MHSVVIISVACALALGRDPASQPATMCGLRIAMTLGSVFAVCHAARLVTLTCRSSGNSDSSLPLQRLEQAHLGLWLAVVAFLIFIVDWVTIVRINLGLEHAILIDDLLILLPLALPWLISWAIFHDLPAESTPESSNRWHFMLRQARVTFGIGLLPVLVVCTISDLVDRFRPEWAEGTMAPALFVLPLLGILTAYPWLMRALWPTRVLPPGPLRTRLERLASTNQIAIREMLIWETGNGAANAAVTGVLPGLRYVFITQGLLDEMSDDDIEAIFAHELGHVSHGHLALRIIALLLPICLCLAISNVGLLLDPGHNNLEVPTSSRFDNSLTSALLLLATLSYMGFALGWYARRLEHQADLWACQHLPQGAASKGNASDDRYQQVLRRLTANDEMDQRSWLHPSPADRLRFLQSTVKNLPRTDWFDWQLRMLALTMRAITVLAISSMLMMLILQG